MWYKIVLLLILVSCTPKREDKIVIPEVGESFYSQALQRINEDLEGDEHNLHLVEQKIYYCDYLEWPSTCVDALDEFKRQKGMTAQLLDQYATYFLKHQQYEQLLNVINRWAGEFDFKESYWKYQVLASTKLAMNNEASALLRRYMSKRSSLRDIKFAAERFIEMEDTLMSSYYLGKLMKLDPSDVLVVRNYALMLFDLGYQEKAFEILDDFSVLNPNDFEFNYALSSRYAKAGYLAKARDKLKPFAASDTITYELANLHMLSNEWDSAHLYIDRILERDSLNKRAWLTKATLYEQRGWLNYSLNYFNHVLYLYPTDTIAQVKAATVERKIAYLQRKKIEENQLPLLNIESKKIINNE